jgi:hypothetical protein
LAGKDAMVNHAHGLFRFKVRTVGFSRLFHRPRFPWVFW